MLQQPVSPEPGRDGDPSRVEEDWLAWCEAVEEQLGPDEDEPEDAAPWDVDIDALIAECREIVGRRRPLPCGRRGWACRAGLLSAKAGAARASRDRRCGDRVSSLAGRPGSVPGWRWM
jgi:hypothetical protein